jgi:DNA-binding transcriptional LysR family regulator
VGDIYQSVADGTLDIGYATGLREQRETSRAGTRRIVAVPFRSYQWFLVASPRLLEQSKAHDGTTAIFLPAYAHLVITRLKAWLPDESKHHFTLAQDTEAAKTAAEAQLGIACVPAYTVRAEVLAGSLVRWYSNLPAFTSVIHIAHQRPPRHPDVSLVVAATRRLEHFLPDGGLVGS